MHAEEGREENYIDPHERLELLAVIRVLHLADVVDEDGKEIEP